MLAVFLPSDTYRGPGHFGPPPRQPVATMKGTWARTYIVRPPTESAVERAMLAARIAVENEAAGNRPAAVKHETEAVPWCGCAYGGGVIFPDLWKAFPDGLVIDL